MKFIKQRAFVVICTLMCLSMIAGCASTKKASVPSAWGKNIDWQVFNSAEVTETEHVIVQNKEEIMIFDGQDGRTIHKDLKEKKGGFFGALGDAVKESVSSSFQNPFGADNDVNVKYWHLSLPASQTLMLFDRTTDTGEIIAFDLKTGQKKWTTKEMPWSLEKFKDEAGFAVELASQTVMSALGAEAVSAVLLQSRAINNMIEEVPEKDAFLFRTVNGKLNLVNNNTGEVIWTTEEFKSTGIGALTYLSDSDEFLIAGDMGNLKDAIKSSDAEVTMKQLYLVDASTGDVKWSSKYSGRAAGSREINKAGDEIRLYFSGGYAEVFKYDDGTPVFNSIDGNMAGTRKATAAAFGDGEGNVLGTRETATPVFEGNHVYAVNVVATHTVGYPDKQIFKFNYKTGETTWKSPVLEYVPDVRDMLVTEDLVIVRVTLTDPDEAMGKRGAVVGGVKDFGFYAFDKETGEPAWSYTEPFIKHVTNVIYGDNVAWAAGDNTVYKFKLSNGGLMQSKTYDDPNVGTIFMMHERGDGQLFLRGLNGFAVISRDSLSASYSSGLDGRMAEYSLSDQFFTVKTEKLLSEKQNIQVFDLRANKLKTEFTIQRPENSVFGNLYDQGYNKISRPQQVLTINPSGLKSYRLQ